MPQPKSGQPHPKSAQRAGSEPNSLDSSEASGEQPASGSDRGGPVFGGPVFGGPVFGIKTARGQAPYAILGGRRSASSGEASGRVEDDAPSAHSLRVAGGQVVPATTGTRSGANAAGETASGETASGETASGETASGETASGENRGEGVCEVRLPEIDPSMPPAEKPAEAMRLAQEAFSQTGYWVSFYRAILSTEGALYRLFPTREEMAYFEETREFAEIHKMLTALRTSDVEKIDAVEPQTMITIRMPRSLRGVLVDEAAEHGVSINKLCISKLLLPISGEYVPRERGKVRGRKPGQQARSNRGKSSRAKSNRTKSGG